MDSRVRAIDVKTGKVLWKHLVDAPAVALPATYVQGQAIRGVRRRRQLDPDPKGQDQLVAFALPDNAS